MWVHSKVICYCTWGLYKRATPYTLFKRKIQIRHIVSPGLTCTWSRLCCFLRVRARCSSSGMGTRPRAWWYSNILQEKKTYFKHKSEERSRQWKRSYWLPAQGLVVLKYLAKKRLILNTSQKTEADNERGLIDYQAKDLVVLKYLARKKRLILNTSRKSEDQSRQWERSYWLPGPGLSGTYSNILQEKKRLIVNTNSQTPRNRQWTWKRSLNILIMLVCSEFVNSLLIRIHSVFCPCTRD